MIFWRESKCVCERERLAACVGERHDVRFCFKHMSLSHFTHELDSHTQIRRSWTQGECCHTRVSHSIECNERLSRMRMYLCRFQLDELHHFVAVTWPRDIRISTYMYISTHIYTHIYIHIYIYIYVYITQTTCGSCHTHVCGSCPSRTRQSYRWGGQGR